VLISGNLIYGEEIYDFLGCIGIIPLNLLLVPLFPHPLLNKFCLKFKCVSVDEFSCCVIRFPPGPGSDTQRTSSVVSDEN
jgi:hypothetical protein